MVNGAFYRPASLKSESRQLKILNHLFRFAELPASQAPREGVCLSLREAATLIISHYLETSRQAVNFKMPKLKISAAAALYLQTPCRLATKIFSFCQIQIYFDEA